MEEIYEQQKNLQPNDQLQNKNRQISSEQVKLNMNVDPNNPRYKLFKDLDLSYTMLQV